MVLGLGFTLIRGYGVRQADGQTSTVYISWLPGFSVLDDWWGERLPNMQSQFFMPPALVAPP